MKILKSILRLSAPIGFVLIFAAVIIINIVHPSTNFNFIPVQSEMAKESDSAYLASLPILKDYQNAQLKGEHVLILKKNSFINFAAPKTSILIDNLYALAFLLLLIFFIITFWQFNTEKPFNRNLISYFSKLEIVLAAVWILNIIRHYLLDHYFLRITNNEYSLDIFIWGMPEFWFLFLVANFKKIIKSGLALQEDQSLTV